jgi:hypothetical protein
MKSILSHPWPYELFTPEEFEPRMNADCNHEGRRPLKLNAAVDHGMSISGIAERRLGIFQWMNRCRCGHIGWRLQIPFLVRD